MHKIILSNGVEIPHIGLGTYPMHGQALTDAVWNAYRAGYRMIDTADNYYNEEDLGFSLANLYKRSGCLRSDLFLVSKVSDELYLPHEAGGGRNKGIYFWRNSPLMQGNDAVRKVVREKIHNTLRFLRTDYLDLYLMHWPYPDFFPEIWHEMENLYKEGLVRAIGVCNCRKRHLEKLKRECEITPMVNQFETSPLNTKEGLAEYCNEQNIRVMVYSPLMSLRRNEYPEYQNLLRGLADKYGCSKAQIVLRFDIQRGLIPIPKSSSAERLKANIDIDRFMLDNHDMQRLMACNVDLPYMPESRSCPGL